MLKNSARNASCTCSVMAIFFSRDKSTLTRSGPGKKFLDNVPYVAWGQPPGVPGGAVLLKQAGNDSPFGLKMKRPVIGVPPTSIVRTVCGSSCCGGPPAQTGRTRLESPKPDGPGTNSPPAGPGSPASTSIGKP